LSEIKPNILIITSRSDFGGGPEHIFKLVNNLKEQVSFCIAAPTDYPYYDKYSKLIGKENILVIPHRKFKISPLFKLVWIVKKRKIDIVHSHGKGAGIYSRLVRFFRNVKVIHTFHGIHVDNYNSFQKFLYILLERLLALKTDKFINVSQGENVITKKYHIASSDKLIVIENGVEIPEIKVDNNNFEQNPKIIVSFSRFDHSKNSELLIPIALGLKELNQINDFRILVYGEGPDQNKVKELIKTNSLAEYIILKGTTTEPDKILLSSFCYISTSRWEGMPLGVLEAYAHGLPVIATNVTGNFNIVENNVDGFLFDINKPYDASKLIIDLSNNKTLWKSLSDNSRLKAERNYSINRVVAETKKLYLKIIS
jgi:glycosyltransferase involved in cell wall biosynthesis